MNKLFRFGHKDFREAMKKHKDTSGIYIWYCNKECIYVGATIHVGYRGTRVFWSGGDCSKPGRKIDNMIKKFGINKIYVIIIPCNEEDLRKLEKIFFSILMPKAMSSCPPYVPWKLNRNK